MHEFTLTCLFCRISFFSRQMQLLHNDSDTTLRVRSKSQLQINIKRQYRSSNCQKQFLFLSYKTCSTWPYTPTLQNQKQKLFEYNISSLKKKKTLTIWPYTPTLHNQKQKLFKYNIFSFKKKKTLTKFLQRRHTKLLIVVIWDGSAGVLYCSTGHRFKGGWWGCQTRQDGLEPSVGQRRSVVVGLQNTVQNMEPDSVHHFQVEHKPSFLFV